MLLHRLEQRGLGARRRPVHLVDEEHVREDRALDEAERATLVDAAAGHVAGQQVRRALDAGERQAEGARERAGKERLADARHVLDERMALGEQRHREQPERIVGIDDRTCDLGPERGPEAIAGVAGIRRPGGRVGGGSRAGS